jgi:DNA-binding transcriptional LysR family regulator
LNEQVDDFFAGGFDLGIRIGQQQDASLAQHPLGMIESWLCASPNYLQQAGVPITPQDLTKHNCLLWQPRERMAWREWVLDKNGKSHRINVRGNFISNDSLALREATRNHGGIALLPLYAIQDDIRQGILIRVLDDHQTLPFPLTIVYSHRQVLSSKLRVFIEFIEMAFAEWLTK